MYGMCGVFFTIMVHNYAVSVEVPTHTMNAQSFALTAKRAKQAARRVGSCVVCERHSIVAVAAHESFLFAPLMAARCVYVCVVWCGSESAPISITHRQFCSVHSTRVGACKERNLIRPIRLTLASRKHVERHWVRESDADADEKKVMGWWFSEGAEKRVASDSVPGQHTHASIHTKEVFSVRPATTVFLPPLRPRVRTEIYKLFNTRNGAAPCACKYASITFVCTTPHAVWRATCARARFPIDSAAQRVTLHS